MSTAIEQRRDLYRKRRLAWTALAVSVIAVVLWEALIGPPPEGIGYRFSPMYVFTLEGIAYWVLVAIVLLCLGLLHWSYMARDPLICCPQCQSCRSSKDDWVCPHCSEENHPTRGGALNVLYTVLTRCKRCGKAPECYRCPQCGHTFDLQEDANHERPARPPEHAASAQQ